MDNFLSKYRKKGRDIGWLAGGGDCDRGGSGYWENNLQLWLLKENLRWECLDEVELPRARSQHCMIQIDEHEVAFIAGSTNAEIGNHVMTIDIFNFDKKTWREGPE